MRWPKQVNHFLDQLNIQQPIIQAPMAGGYTTSELVSAVANAGGLGSIGAGLMTPADITKIIHETRQLTNQPFTVNLFAPLAYKHEQDKIKKMYQFLAVYRDELGMDSPSIPEINPPPDFETQLDAIVNAHAKIISFTFGTPDFTIIQKLRSQNMIVIGTATNVREAIELENLGYTMIVAQGSEAGGHRGTFLGSFESSLIGSMALIPQIVDAVSIPVIAAGGIMDGRGVAASITLGACGVQMGTAFLTCPEAGTHFKHKEAILQSTEENTTITSVFSGRPARGIRNRFIDEVEKYSDFLPDYPLQQSLTSPIRKKAAEQNRSEFFSLWAGQGTRLNQIKPAAQLIHDASNQAMKILTQTSLVEKL